VTLSDDDQAQLRAWQLGASAHLPLTATPEEVVATIRQAVAAPSAFLGEDLLALRRSPAGSGPRLTPREAEVLHLAAEGLSVAAISRRLFVTEATTKSHLSGIYRKLGVSTRAAAVLAAERLGMLR
jgi:DNA-binding NarL/FixJ family response regulator